MRFTPPLLLFFALLFPTSTEAVHIDCPRFAPPKITINTISVKPTINHEKDLVGIRQIAAQNQKDIALGSGETPVGLTAATLSMTSSFRIMTASNKASPMSCTQVTEIKVNIGFEDTTIYMPIELKKHTCAYHSVLEHERKHVRTDKAFLKRIAPDIKRELTRTIQKIGLIRSGSQKHAADKISKALNNKLKELGKKYASTRRKWHKHVDTKQEYERIGRSCGGRLRETINEATKNWER